MMWSSSPDPIIRSSPGGPKYEVASLLGLTSGLALQPPPKAVAELPSSPCPALTRIMEAEVAVGTLVPLVGVGTHVVELGLPVPAAYTAL